ncbi:MAG: ATP-dependent DNA helicase [Candidatus Paceibacterota bacterium]
MIQGIFEEEYKKLNKAQKEAVDTIDGPVMVVAGPGTGKTQVLALRIANILDKTDNKGDSILCLTFTNAGVQAMRDRLHHYIGREADSVSISTFHSFAIKLIEEHYELLDFSKIPELLADDKAVFLVDEILYENEWEYLRPRANPSMYFNDLKQLISILKRERITASEFLSHIEKEIKDLENDPDSISSRGESKGKLKKEIEKKIEALLRTSEVVEFYRIYEEKKKELGFMDYDDVLEYATKLVENFEDIRSDIRENYLYVLVDEHQDSSGVQNSFLKAVWGDVEMPNIFVVGDDRQLIYGFSGASLSYFEEFSHFFGKAKLISLIENYRSTSSILSIADDLLKSTMTIDKLKSNIKGQHKIMLNEYNYPRDEIISAGLYFKQKISEGIDPNECALLVPRNYNVRTALEILNNLDLPVSNGKSLSLFSVRETEVFRRILGIIVSPFNSMLLSLSLLDKESDIEVLKAHSFLKSTDPKKLSIEDLINFGGENSLFPNENEISKWGEKLRSWVNDLSNEKLSIIVSRIGNELLINSSKNNEELLSNIEVVRSFIHLAILFEERNKNAKLLDFLKYIDRLDSYNSHINLVKFGNENGIRVMTLHKSKGLEYKCVWIAHMNEEILMSEKRGGFTLPEKIKEHMTKRDVEIAKKELYVALTRAKEFCVISYALENYNGADMKVADIIRDLPELHFIKKSADETEKEILDNDFNVYTQLKNKEKIDIIEDLKKLVQENYTDRKVSVTLLNNFFECPWRWYFRNFLRLPDVKGFSLIFGTVVHSTIEYILKQKKLPNQKELENKIINFILKEGLDEEGESKKIKKEALFAVNNYIENYYSLLSKDFKSEFSISHKDNKFPHLNIYGKIDLVEYLPDDFIRVTDFKTGSIKTKGIIEKKQDNRMSSYLRQLAMYSYLISGGKNNKSVAESRFLFLEEDMKNKNSLYSTHIEKEQIDLLIKDIEDYDTLLKSGDWVNNKCNYKGYGKNTLCEYCKMAKIYKH